MHFSLAPDTASQLCTTLAPDIMTHECINKVKNENFIIIKMNYNSVVKKTRMFAAVIPATPAIITGSLGVPSFLYNKLLK